MKNLQNRLEKLEKIKNEEDDGFVIHFIQTVKDENGEEKNILAFSILLEGDESLLSNAENQMKSAINKKDNKIEGMGKN